MKKKLLVSCLCITIVCIIFAGCNPDLNDEENTSTDTDQTSSLVYTLPPADNTADITESDISTSATDAASPNTGASISSSVPYGEAANPSTDSTESSEDYEIGTYVVNTKTDPLSLRLAPSASDDTMTISTIPKGTKIKVLAVQDGWGYVVYGKIGGWVAMKYLKPAV